MTEHLAITPGATTTTHSGTWNDWQTLHAAGFHLTHTGQYSVQLAAPSTRMDDVVTAMQDLADACVELQAAWA